MLGFGPEHTSYNPGERTITASNLANLQRVWTASGGIGDGFAVADGAVYVSGYNNAGFPTLAAFDATGRTGCSGAPKTCQPLWKAPVVSQGSSPAVVGGVVYVAQGVFGGGPPPNELLAFDAAGRTGCTGTAPDRTCTPLWKASLPSGNFAAVKSPVVSKGVVYFGGGGTIGGELVAYEAAASPSHCSGTAPNKICQPLWKGSTGTFAGNPIVSNGIVFVPGSRPGGGSDVVTYAFDAAAPASRCTGMSPNKTCTALWTTSLGGPWAATSGVLYDGDPGNMAPLAAFDATGAGPSCTGTPKVCAPRWYYRDASAPVSPAVANGVLYTTTAAAPGRLAAFDATGGGPTCTGTPRFCTPLWTSSGTSGPPAVANGVVYASGPAAGQLSAYDAAGTANCSGTPKTCTPLRTINVNSGDELKGQPVIANGTVYAVAWNTTSPPPIPVKLYAWRLP
jgi:hypothetical protein